MIIGWKPYVEFNLLKDVGSPRAPGRYLVKLRGGYVLIAELVASGHGFTGSLKWDLPDHMPDVIEWTEICDERGL